MTYFFEGQLRGSGSKTFGRFSTRFLAVAGRHHRVLRACCVWVDEESVAMTTTVSVSQKGQVELPAEFRRRKKIKPGMSLRVTEIGDGLYVTPLLEPTEQELREIIAAAGSLARRETS